MKTEKLSTLEHKILKDIAERYPYSLADVVQVYIDCKSFDKTIEMLDYGCKTGLLITGVPDITWGPCAVTEGKIEGLKADVEELKAKVNKQAKGLYRDGLMWGPCAIDLPPGHTWHPRCTGHMPWTLIEPEIIKEFREQEEAIKGYQITKRYYHGKDKGMEIQEVKRLSDDLIVQIGDTDIDGYIVKGFREKGDRLEVIFKSKATLLCDLQYYEPIPSKCKYTPEKRIDVYNRLITLYRETKKQARIGLCEILELSDMSIKDFPELMAQKPKGLKTGDYWFDFDWLGFNDARIEVLEKAIKMLKSEKDYKIFCVDWMKDGSITAVMRLRDNEVFKIGDDEKAGKIMSISETPEGIWLWFRTGCKPLNIAEKKNSTKHTPKKRLEVYRDLKAAYLFGNETGICSNLLRMKLDIKDFPEIMIQKPEDVKNDGYWFGGNENRGEFRRARIKVLDNAISMIEEKGFEILNTKQETEFFESLDGTIDEIYGIKEITTVKRLSDGKIISIGDTVYTQYWKGKVKSIDLISGVIVIITFGEDYTVSLSDVKG